MSKSFKSTRLLFFFNSEEKIGIWYFYLLGEAEIPKRVIRYIYSNIGVTTNKIKVSTIDHTPPARYRTYFFNYIYINTYTFMYFTHMCRNRRIEVYVNNA